ncbi:MAG TPA: arabinan endo-1,5-alpha-L-arabinosidase [Verrucomicrobiae bacterium]|nr:arabinan endo-1,5-alpha-L-arabinosidase [Verrucomicrobiae bacterium]
MNKKFLPALILCGAVCLNNGCQSPRDGARGEAPILLPLTGDRAVHDPVLIREKDQYFLFSTGGGPRGDIIPIRCSTNLLHWERCGSVFERLPEWATNEIARARGSWAPDISFYNGKYHLYYSLSSFGVNESAIGLAVNQTLDRNDPRYRWIDQGLVIRSRPGVTDFNAIDPNLVLDGRRAWLCWGSFWGGIMMREIDPKTGKASSSNTNLYVLASRPRVEEHKTPPVEGAIESPTIIKRGGFWYLFASYDFCCRGTNSTYNVKVGRSRKVTGPYVDRDGRRLADDGGTPVIEAQSEKWAGAGHQTFFSDKGKDYLVFHAYNRTNGQSRLQISTVVWENGWPKAASR